MDDRGLAYGDGLFETILVRGGVPILWEHHLSRLRRGCEGLGFPCPSLTSLEAAFSSLNTAPHVLNVVKIIVTRGSGGRGYMPPANPQPRLLVHHSDFAPQQSRWSVVNRVRISRLRLGYQPQLAGIKHLNRLENVLARQELTHANADRQNSEEYVEGILADFNGALIEATAMNLCWHEKGKWFTPALASCGVAGTLRAALIEAGMLTESSLTLSNIAQAEAFCLLNSVQGVWPIQTIDDEYNEPLWIAQPFPLHHALQREAHRLLGYETVEL